MSFWSWFSALFCVWLFVQSGRMLLVDLVKVAKSEWQESGRLRLYVAVEGFFWLSSGAFAAWSLAELFPAR